MKLYPRLAIGGIRKNSALYIPYILTCLGMVMIFYILSSLSCCQLLSKMLGGSSVKLILSLGSFIVGFFSLIFLFYTNSFLINRRNREFGLYNVLGMDRGKIRRIVVWEGVFIGLFSIVLGIILGIAFSKFAELFLLKAVRFSTDYTFRVPFKAIKFTAIIYAVIFALITIKSLVSVSKTGALELLKAENLGEKPPKSNIVLAVLGVIILGIAYYIAVSIKQPLTALMLFFVAVLLVIAASYLLFVSGSVTLCRALHKNKKYYYSKKHFVSVSQMAYRMKRNGAGLASICVLSSLILGGFVSTSCLYFGAEDTINSQYPYDSVFSITINHPNGVDSSLDELNEKIFTPLRAIIDKSFEEKNIVPEKAEEISYAYVYGTLNDDGEIDINADKSIGGASSSELEKLSGFFFLSIDSFNAITGRSDSVEAGEAIICPLDGDYKYSYLNLDKLHIKVSAKYYGFPTIGELSGDNIVRGYVVVLPGLECLRPVLELKDCTGDDAISLKWSYGYNISASSDEIIAIFDEQKTALFDNDFRQYNIFSTSYRADNKELAKYDFYSVYGGLFFIGILLSLIFICATVLIIYYKQVSEGYEDAPRFEIMKKIGMTEDDIRKNVNSQMITVFYSPLIMAGVHLCFAFPMVWRCLQIFCFTNVRLMIATALIAYLVFAVFYTIVYRLTTKKYISIVS